MRPSRKHSVLAAPAATASAERLSQRSAAASLCGIVTLAPDDPERRQALHGGRRAARAGTRKATYAQSSPSSRSAAFCIAGDRECSTGSPSTHARPVVARIT